MAAAAEPRPRPSVPEQRIVLRGVGWEGYEAILKLVGDRPAIRTTYDRGDLELMSPSYDHERFKEFLGRAVVTIMEECYIPGICAGSTTWRRRLVDRGLEADACYYIANFPRVAGKKTIDLEIDPPPDLAIEIEITHGALDRMGTYAALGVPEVWRFDGETLLVAHLQADGTYALVESSPNLPFVPLDDVVAWVQQSDRIADHFEWGRRFREWVRNELAPRFEKG